MSIYKRIAAFRYAINGLIDAFWTQAHMKFHAVAATGVLLAAWFFRVETWEWCILIFLIGSILATETMNTAIEYVVNLVSPEHHPLAGKAKDAAAAAVLLLSIAAAAIALLIFGHRLLNLL